MTSWTTVSEIVRDRYDEDEGRGVPTDDVVEQAVRNGVSREAAENAVDELLKRGEVYRPDPNDDRLKPTTLHV
jgi:DNA replicative helicase MCM subunit Mcm2 (Cdc46/Mcm family)